MPAFQRNIQHVVVLMLENRSFDHMLGFFGKGDGLNGTEFNFADPPSSGAKVLVSKDASYTGDLDVDPSHRLEDINIQLFNTATPPTPAPAATNIGFVKDYGLQPGATPGTAANIMKCFDPDRLPALKTLASEFVLCDRWFSSLPAQTWPNRFFVHAATSMGQIDNQPRVYPARTIYDNLTQAGEDWSIYFHDIPQSLMLTNLQRAKYHKNFKVFAERFKANDQHPPHDVALGDVLIADVYETIRNSPMWDSTLLVVLWDEHGGIYDHVPPPATVNPDFLVHTNPDFDFTRLGVRVPAVIVSPWVERGKVDSTVYDHSSVPASLKELLDLPSFLTRRDAAANTLAHLVGDDKRTDAPLTLPRATDAAPVAPTTAVLTNADVIDSLNDRSTEPLSEFQQSLIDLTRTLPLSADDRLRVASAASVPVDEHGGAVHVRQAVQLFLDR
jgi:phospholipase C